MTENLRLVGQRLKQFMQVRGLSLQGVARMSPLSDPELDAIINGGVYPVSRLLVLLDLFDDLNPEWLLHGEGAMLRKGTPHVAREFRPDAEARAILRRHAAVPTTAADRALAERLTTLEAALSEQQELLAALTARLARLEK